MPPTLPSSIRAVIDAHKHDTTLFVLALGDPCTDLARRLVARIPRPRATAQGVYGRHAQRLGLDRLGDVEASSSWTLAVLNCGADPSNLVKWANRLTARARTRLRIYQGKDAKVFRGWPDPLPEIPDIEDEDTMLRMVLEQLNEQTYQDHADDPPPGVG